MSYASGFWRLPGRDLGAALRTQSNIFVRRAWLSALEQHLYYTQNEATCLPNTPAKGVGKLTLRSVAIGFIVDWVAP